MLLRLLFRLPVWCVGVVATGLALVSIFAYRGSLFLAGAHDRWRESLAFPGNSRT